MSDLSIFCPWCGAEYFDFLDTVETLMLWDGFNIDASGVLRRCLSCYSWERPDEGRRMIEMITREGRGNP